MQASAGNLKKVQLELGGKGANIVFDDANLVAAVNGSAWAIFHNQGQACIAGSRLLLHEKIAEAFLEKFVALARSIKLGNPLDPATEMGPLTSAQHRDRVLSYVEVARGQGGEVLAGGTPPVDNAALAKGCYVEPTVVRARDYRDRVAQEEVFGPFVTVLTFKDDDEALTIANGTDYGLGSGLWTTNLARAHRFARELHAGMVWINSYKRVNPGSPFGGVGQSGYGREMGFDAMREYTQVKSVWVNVDAQIPPWYLAMQPDAGAAPLCAGSASRGRRQARSALAASEMNAFSFEAAHPARRVRRRVAAATACRSRAARRDARARVVDAGAGGVGAPRRRVAGTAQRRRVCARGDARADRDGA